MAAAKGLHLVKSGLPEGMALPFLFGVISAAVSGYLVIRFFLAYLQRHTLYPFVLYRIAVGVPVIYLAARAIL